VHQEILQASLPPVALMLHSSTSTARLPATIPSEPSCTTRPGP